MADPTTTKRAECSRWFPEWKSCTYPECGCDKTDAVEAARPPPLTSLKVVVDHAVPPDELRVHPAMFDLLQRAFQEAEMMRSVKGLLR